LQQHNTGTHKLKLPSCMTLRTWYKNSRIAVKGRSQVTTFSKAY